MRVAAILAFGVLQAAAWFFSWNQVAEDAVRVRAAGQIIADVPAELTSLYVPAASVTQLGLVEWRFSILSGPEEGPPVYDYTCHADSADCTMGTGATSPWAASTGCGAGISDNGYAVPPITCQVAGVPAGTSYEVAVEANGGTVRVTPQGLEAQTVAFPAGADTTALLSWSTLSAPTSVAIAPASGAPQVDQVRARSSSDPVWACDANRGRFAACCQTVGC